MTELIVSKKTILWYRLHFAAIGLGIGACISAIIKGDSTPFPYFLTTINLLAALMKYCEWKLITKLQSSGE